MPKFALDIEYDYEFQLFGISCHEKDYRLCWGLNNAFSFELHKIEDLEIKEKKQKEPICFSSYAYSNEESYADYFLIGNKSGKNLLLPEHKQADFLLMIKGSPEMSEEDVVAKLKSVSFILTAYAINVNELKSKKNLVF